MGKKGSPPLISLVRDDILIACNPTQQLETQLSLCFMGMERDNKEKMEERVSVSSRRYEVDSRAQLLSVKEAVILFDQSLISHHHHPPPYNNPTPQLNHSITNKAQVPRGGSVRNRDRPTPTKQASAELQEAKQILEKARWESMRMADSLTSLREELELTKKELREFRGRAFQNQYDETDGEMTEFQRNRYINFTNPGPLNRITILGGGRGDNGNKNHKRSLKTKVKRMWVAASLTGGGLLFSSKK